MTKENYFEIWGKEFVDDCEKHHFKIQELPFTMQEIEDFINSVEEWTENAKFSISALLGEFRKFILENKTNDNKKDNHILKDLVMKDKELNPLEWHKRFKFNMQMHYCNTIDLYLIDLQNKV